MQMLDVTRYDRRKLDNRDNMRDAKIRKGSPIPGNKPVREVQSGCDLACSEGTDASSDRVEWVEGRSSASKFKQRGSHGAADWRYSTGSSRRYTSGHGFAAR